MAYTETKLSGRKFRTKNPDKENDYYVHSFVTDAADVKLGNGTSIESKIGTIDTELASLKKSVSDGKTLVANAITAQGVTTATNAAFATMSANIKTMATNRYNAGVTAADARVNTNSASYKNGYTAGKNNGASLVGSYVECTNWKGQGYETYRNWIVLNVANQKSITIRLYCFAQGVYDSDDGWYDKGGQFYFSTSKTSEFSVCGGRNGWEGNVTVSGSTDDTKASWDYTKDFVVNVSDVSQLTIFLKMYYQIDAHCWAKIIAETF